MNSNAESSSAHKISLARDLLDDIELGRLTPEKLLLKATRLARLIGDDEVRKWLAFELSGYISDDPISLKYMSVTGRWTDYEQQLGYWQSFAQIDAQIETNKLQIKQLRIPDVTFSPSSSHPGEFVVGMWGQHIQTATQPITTVLANLNTLNTYVTQLSGVRSKVLSLIHGFVSKAYYELAFSNLQETIFERQKALVDAKITTACGAILEKVPAIYDRLAQDDKEAISQALNTCRRIIDAFADSIYPPTDKTIDIGGIQLKLKAQHHQNRINAFVFENCESSSRRSRFKRSLSDLYDRVGAGIHSDVTAGEARFLFLQTYMLIGEILSLKEEKAG